MMQHGSHGPLRIAIASRAPFVGGAELAAERLASGLERAGHRVVLLLGEDNAVSERVRAAGLEYHRFDLPLRDRWHALRYLRARGRLRRFLHRFRPDIVHSNDLPTHQIVSDAVRARQRPTVCHHRFPYPGKAIDWFNRFGADRHLFVSASLMEQMCSASESLQAASRAVLYDGLELPTALGDRERQRQRQQLELPSDRTIVLFAGQMIERKGVADLLEAWSRLPAATARRARLYLLGDDLRGEGAYRRQMESLARSLGIDCVFSGFQRRVHPWLVAASVAVVPSHLEPLGNAALEAMAAGLPVVATRVGGLPETVIDGETGLLVPPRSPARLAAAIAELIEDPERARRLGRAGRRRCEKHFSLEAHTAAALREYRLLLAGGTSPATSATPSEEAVG